MTPSPRPATSADIRPAVRGDIPGILAINRSATPGVTRLSRADVASLLSISPHFLVAGFDGEIAGYLIAMRFDTPYAGEEFLRFQALYPRFLYIDQVAIAAGRRRQGLAALLYDHAEGIAAAARLPLLACEVNTRPPNPQSVAFHVARRFREVGRMDLADGRSAALYARTVGAS